MADKLPGNGMFGWLGRQVGYVKKAVKTPPAALPKPKTATAPPRQTPPPKPNAASDTASDTPTVVYREGRVEEAEHPSQPGVKLRRTVIDEVIVDPDATPPAGTTRPPQRQ